MTPEHSVVVVQSSNFGSTLAVLLVVILLTGLAILYFMKHRKIKEEQMTFEQVQSIIYEEVRDVCELALVRKNLNRSSRLTLIKNCRSLTFIFQALRENF